MGGLLKPLLLPKSWPKILCYLVSSLVKVLVKSTYLIIKLIYLFLYVCVCVLQVKVQVDTLSHAHAEHDISVFLTLRQDLSQSLTVLGSLALELCLTLLPGITGTCSHVQLLIWVLSSQF